MDCAPARGTADSARRSGKTDRRAGCSGGSGREERCSGATAPNPSRSGTDYGIGFLAYLGADRTLCSQQTGSQLSWVESSEHSSGGRQRTGSISKQGNAMLRTLLVEAGQISARFVPELKRAYQRLKHRKHSAVAKVMVARKLA